MKKENDYRIFLAIIAIWMMVGGIAQCESARSMDSIRRELSDIKHEINLLKYK